MTKWPLRIGVCAPAPRHALQQTVPGPRIQFKDPVGRVPCERHVGSSWPYVVTFLTV